MLGSKDSVSKEMKVVWSTGVFEPLAIELSGG